MLQVEHHLVNYYLENDISIYISPPDTDPKIDNEEVKHQHELVADQMARQYQINQDDIILCKDCHIM